MPKIVSVSPLAADPGKNKLILDDGAVVHVLKTGREYEVGEEYEAEDTHHVTGPLTTPVAVEPEEQAIAQGLNGTGDAE